MLLKSPWTPRLADIDAHAAARLVRALADDIVEGRMADGDRLPAQREVAWRLGIGLGTVTKAYAILERRGLVRSVRGSGTFVAAHQAGQGAKIDLSVNTPPPILTRRLLARSLLEVSRKVDADHFTLYAPPEGHPDHRRLLARWLETLGIGADPRHLVLTGGAQQALALAFDLACGRDGVVVTERLTYPGAITLCRHAGLAMRGVPVDEEGMTPAGLAQALGEGGTRRRAVYVTPTLHNPTTATMGVARRQAIVEVCRAHDARIVEDGVYRADAEAEPPLVTLAPERCLFVGSLSKTVSPGLRVGVLVVPPDLEHSAACTVQALPFAPSPLSCAIVEEWLTNGTIDAVWADLTADAARRADLAVALLRGRPLVCRRSAFHAWLPMPRRAAERFAAEAAGFGIVVTPPRAVMIDANEEDSGIRLCLGGPSLNDLTRALTLLSGVGQEPPAVVQ